MRWALCLAGFLAGAMLLPAAPAGAQNQIYRDYADDGQINPCNYSRGQLERGLEGLPPDLEQYAPEVGDQLRRPCQRGGSAAAPSPEDEENAPGAAGGGGGGPPRAIDIPRPPAPRPGERRAIDAPLPAFSATPKGPDAPGWLVALLVLIGLGGGGALLASRYAGVGYADVVGPLRARFSR